MFYYYRLIFIICLYGLSLTSSWSLVIFTHFSTTHYIQIFYSKFQKFLVNSLVLLILGTAGDSFSGHRGQPFTTKNQDNDSHASSNCAVSYKGAWWYTNCQASNLNGLYHHGSHSSPADRVSWYAWKGHYYSAKRAEMKIRPVNF